VGASVLIFEDLELPAFAALEPETETLPGPSVALQRVRAEVKLVAPQTVPVLLLGESGVGKEVVAEELHRQSGRQGSFVPVNCAAIAPELAESELFGHAAGAFTGATRRSEGLFVAAQGGTLFLDEIGEMPFELQAKLLRALARGEIRPVGAAQATTVDVRIVAATNRDVHAAAREGTLRGDLLARLMGWMLRLPPLRHRAEDVLALSRRFLERRGHRAEMTADAAEALLLHDWPYNVRELEHLITMAAVRAAGNALSREHLPQELIQRLRDRAFTAPTSAIAPEVPLELLVPRDHMPTSDGLKQVLEYFGGNMARVADFFQKDRRQIYRWAEKLGIDPGGFRVS
jgi:two-component system response regulator HydG